MGNTAKDFYSQGYSCSEAIIKSAAAKGYIQNDLVKLGTAFSGGMSSGCLCGAIAGAQIVLSFIEGRCELSESRTDCKNRAKEFIDKFKAKNKYTCCKVLSSKYDFGSLDRKENCKKLVDDADMILNEMLTKKVNV